MVEIVEILGDGHEATMRVGPVARVTPSVPVGDPRPERALPAVLAQTTPGAEVQREGVELRFGLGQEEQLGALGLIVNAIVLYNTIYTQRALDHLTEQGLTIEDADLQRLSPLATDHITLTGRYRIALPEALRDHGAYRELNTTPALAA